jgi:predicted kinase
MKVIFTVGLPASGKSTWARNFVEKNKDWIRISRDDLRNMRGTYWIPKQEKLITKLEVDGVLTALEFGKNAVVDATNLNPGFLEGFVKKIKDEYPDTQIEKKFFEIDVKEAIKRDLTRTASVGAEVIQGMYDKYLAPEPVVYSEDKSLPRAVIFDVDGTLAKMNGRSPFEWERVGEDLPKTEIITLAQMYKENGYKLIIFTGRDGVCLGKTKLWLDDYLVPYDEVYIRPEGDQRKDSIIKKELFENNIRGKYYVDLIVDDRDQVVEMWRKELGLTCLQVDYGNF